MPTIEDQDVDEVVDVVRSGWLTSGPRIQKFEHEFATEVGTASALALSSGTAAMHVALIAMGIAGGHRGLHHADDVLLDRPRDRAGRLPAAVRRRRARHAQPRPGRRRARAGRTVAHDVGAILPVHYAGHPVRARPDRGARPPPHGVPVVEDAAHAFGAAFRGTPIGAGRPAPTTPARRRFSLYATKNITSGEGGVLTGSDDLLEESRLWSLHGMSRDSWQRYGPRGSWDYEVVRPRLQVQHVRHPGRARQRAAAPLARPCSSGAPTIAARYTELLADVDEIQTPTSRAARHARVAPLPDPAAPRPRWPIDRAEFIDQLRMRNIGTSVHFIPLHVQPYYRDRYGFAPRRLPRHRRRVRPAPLPADLPADDRRRRRRRRRRRSATPSHRICEHADDHRRVSPTHRPRPGQAAPGRRPVPRRPPAGRSRC